VRSFELPIIFLRQPGFLWLGSEGELTDTLCFELADVDKSNFAYRWYKRDPVTLVSTPLKGEYAHNDTLFINPTNREDDYGISERGKVYQFYCVVVRGSQYGISETGYVVYGPGVRLANGGWINIAPANLGADQKKTVEDQIDYTPQSESDSTVYGDWYQWGRQKDGHQARGVASEYSGHLTAPNGVGVDSLNTDDGQIKSGPDFDAIYGKFIQRNASGSTNDWRQYPETEDNSAVYPANNWTWANPDLDPCSELNQGAIAGVTTWRVPTQYEWSQIQSCNTWVWSAESRTLGYMVKPGGRNKHTTLFLPAAGSHNRNGGGPNAVGSSGFYWSSTVSSTNSYRLYFTSGSIGASATYNRADGCTVRCVSEDFSKEEEK
jgi:hypothetical protein